MGFGWAPANCDRSLVGDGGVTIGLMADDIGNGLLSLNEPVTISLMTVTPSERERVMDCIVKVAILVIEYTELVRTRVLPEQICTYAQRSGCWATCSQDDRLVSTEIFEFWNFRVDAVAVGGSIDVGWKLDRPSVGWRHRLSGGITAFRGSAEQSYRDAGRSRL